MSNSTEDVGYAAGQYKFLKEVIGMYWNYHGMTGGHWIMMLIFIILAVMIVYLLMDPKNNKSGSAYGFESYRGGNSEGKALEIINERFAKGEIDEEEYQSKKNYLLKK